MTSGTAGPFLAEPIDVHVHLAIAAANLVVRLYLLIGVTEEDMPRWVVRSQHKNPRPRRKVR
jgi:hypothetical protein